MRSFSEAWSLIPRKPCCKLACNRKFLEDERLRKQLDDLLAEMMTLSAVEKNRKVLQLMGAMQLETWLD